MKRLSATTLTVGLMMGAGTLSAQSQSPKLVVGIVVDQLRGDYLHQLLPYFGDKGFNRLLSEGVYFPDVDFHGTVSDSPSGAAVIYTGAWPVANGVSQAEVLDPTLKRNVATLAADPSKLKPDYSPANLRLSTIADELFISNGNLSKIYSVAGNPQVAVITAGHAGNAAVWMDEATGKWSSPAYYTSLPATVANRNRVSPLSSKAVSSTWKPLHPQSFYPMGKVWNPGDFSYGFSGGNRDAFTRFKASAPFNGEVTDLALEMLKSMHTGGADGATGMLSIEYNLAPIGFDYDGDSRPELIDSYVRLDSELGRLLEAIDRDFGRENTVIFLSSTGYATEPPMPEAEAKIPTGEITLRKTESLLNSFLSAHYGNADYVSLIKDGKLYLDSKEAEKKGIDIGKLRSEAKAFLLRMGGVSEAFTIDEVLTGGSRRAEEIGLGIDTKNSADIFIFFTPGWTVTDDNAYPSVSKKIRLASPPTPAFILAPQVEPQTIEYTVDATVLAPTIANAINIRAPNGAAAKPVMLKKKTGTSR